MSRPCDREEAVVRAVLDGAFSADIEDHLASCPECHETVTVTAWMQDVARVAREAASEGLPDASKIWWRAEVLARLERRRSLVRRAVRPIAVFERWMGAAAALVGILFGWLYADRLLAAGWSAEVAVVVTDPAWIARIGLTAAAILVVTTGVLVDRLRDV